jgi:hypothetical protein
VNKVTVSGPVAWVHGDEKLVTRRWPLPGAHLHARAREIIEEFPPGSVMLLTAQLVWLGRD